MPQFQLYKNANKATQKNYPYLLDIQSNLLSDLRTTVVIPLMPKRLAENHTISRLNPEIRIKSENFTIMTQNLAGIDRKSLGALVCDLGQYRSEIITAIDFVLSGI
jgi:toxin CcdB